MRVFIVSFLIFLFSVSVKSQSMIWIHDTTFYPSVIFTGIDNYDSLNLIMIGNSEGAYRRVIKSTNGGYTWELLINDRGDWTDPIPPHMNDIAYPSKDLCVIACEKGVFLRTTDGGETWDSIKTNIDSVWMGIQYVSMCDDKNGVMASIYEIIVTHDGFKTWEEISPPDDYRIIDIEMISPYTIYCLSLHYDGTFMQDNKFYVSRDGGHSWTEYPHPDYKLASSMKFVDSTFGYICAAVFYKKEWDGKYDRIYRTTDGGKTWDMVLNEYIADDQPFGLQKLDVYDRENAIFVGQFGKVFRTSDGGNSFIKDPIPKIRERLPPTMQVCMLTPKRSIIADYVGRVFHSEYLTSVASIKNNVLLLSPNPAIDYIDVILKERQRLKTAEGSGEANPDLSVKIYDVLGNVVDTPPGPLLIEGEKIRLDVSGLAAGVYFVRVGGRMYKFVKI